MVARIVNFFTRLGVCATAGGISGAMAGMALGGYLFTLSIPHIPAGDAALLGTGIGVLAWFVVLFVLVGICRYLLNDVFLPSLLTALVASAAAAAVVDALRTPAVAMFVGWLVGTIVGALLCRLCRILPNGGFR